MRTMSHHKKGLGDLAQAASNIMFYIGVVLTVLSFVFSFVQWLKGKDNDAMYLIIFSYVAYTIFL